MVALQNLNALPAEQAWAGFLRCCGSSNWAKQMAARRPFASEKELFAAAGDIWSGLDKKDRLEAFSHHPKIGGKDALRARFSSTSRWALSEQSGTSGASEATLARLAEGNAAYEKKFGYIFIVCAAGKSADEMLALLESRLGNDPKLEMGLAAAEQEKITELRLRKLLAG